MRCQKIYPLEVEVPRGGSRGNATGGAVSDPVVVRPVIPGALIVPHEQSLDLARAGSKATFFITPFAQGRLRGAQVDLLRSHRAVETIPLEGRVSIVEQLFWVLVLLVLGSVPALLMVYPLQKIDLTGGTDQILDFARVAGIGIVVVFFLYWVTGLSYLLSRVRGVRSTTMTSTWVLLFLTILLPLGLLYVTRWNQLEGDIPTTLPGLVPNDTLKEDSGKKEEGQPGAEDKDKAGEKKDKPQGAEEKKDKDAAGGEKKDETKPDDEKKDKPGTGDEKKEPAAGGGDDKKPTKGEGDKEPAKGGDGKAQDTKPPVQSRGGQFPNPLAKPGDPPGPNPFAPPANAGGGNAPGGAAAVRKPLDPFAPHIKMMPGTPGDLLAYRVKKTLNEEVPTPPLDLFGETGENIAHYQKETLNPSIAKSLGSTLTMLSERGLFASFWLATLLGLLTLVSWFAHTGRRTWRRGTVEMAARPAGGPSQETLPLANDGPHPADMQP
jgi:hypothetical protein